MDKRRREYQWLFAELVCVVMLLKAEGYSVDITYLRSAVAKGAVCLDGSAPAYHFDKGVGAGINNWLILLEGGSWCNNVTDCAARRYDHLGSSKKMATVLTFSGILHNQQKYNPDFYNWNRIEVRYCDGSSYTGDVEAVNLADKVYYRGARIFAAVIEDLLAKGMKNAQNAILSGCSAGGLGAILQCDNFKSLVPKTAKVKCIADAGYFINVKAVNGISLIEDFYNDVVTTHGSAKNLPASCTSKNKPGLCFFPQNVVQQIQTPLFIVNAAYDSWQVRNILAPGVADPHGTWSECKNDITKCTAAQLKIMHDFRLEFLKALSSGCGDTVASRGFYINSCYSHRQTTMQETWLRDDSPLLGGTTISKAVGDWYYDRSPFKKIDCPYPCDKTCHNRVYEPNQQLLSSEIDIELQSQFYFDL